MSPLDIAIICHEANRVYCQSIGDESQVPWEEAPKWQQDSAVLGVEFIIGNPNAPPSASHESWLEQKRIDGWKHGPLKDAEKKEHPCFVPYDELPIEQQRKDYLFGAIVRALTCVIEVPQTKPKGEDVKKTKKKKTTAKKKKITKKKTK